MALVAKITAKSGHNWKVPGSRASPLLRKTMAAMLEEEGADLRGALSPFRITALSRVPAGRARQGDGERGNGMVRGH